MKLFTIVYRTGGFLNYWWHETLIACDETSAIAAADIVTRMGYMNLVIPVEQKESFLRLYHG